MKTSSMQEVDGWRGQPGKGPLRTILSHPWRLTLLVVGGLIPAVSGAVALSLLHPAPGVSRERVSSPSPEEVDLGTVPQRGRVEKVIAVGNPADSAIEVASLQTSCPCLTIQTTESVIPTSGQISARIVLDLRDDPRFIGGLGIEVTGAGAGGKAVLLVRVKAKVIPGAAKGESGQGK